MNFMCVFAHFLPLLVYIVYFHWKLFFFVSIFYFFFIENCKYHNFFPLINETEYDPSIDEVLLGMYIDLMNLKAWRSTFWIRLHDRDLENWVSGFECNIFFFSSPSMHDRVLNRMEFFLDSDVDQNLSLFTPIGH